MGSAQALLSREDVDDSSRAETDRLKVLHAEAERLAAVLSVEEDALAAAEDSLRAAEARLPHVAEIDADVAVGTVEPEVAAEAKREITETVERATEEKERRERAVEVIRERVRVAGHAVADELLRECARPLIRAQEQLREATAVLEARWSHLETVRAAYERVTVEADEVRAAYDVGLRRQRAERERKKEETLRWALRQPREIIEQLPLALHVEAYRRWDEQNAEAQAYRRKVESERYGDAPRFDEPSETPWRRTGEIL